MISLSRWVLADLGFEPLVKGEKRRHKGHGAPAPSTRYWSPISAPGAP